MSNINNSTTNHPAGRLFTTIPLTQGKSSIVDKDDADLTSLGWFAHLNGNTWYAMRHNGNVLIRLHRLIMARVLERDLIKGEIVDHANGDGLDNRRCNLRLATHAQNLQNSKKPSDNTSGYKGVYFNRQAKKWRARITLNGKQKHLGHFGTPEEAHAAYCEAAKELYGEFARFE